MRKERKDFMKKTIATLLACAMTATVLTGCSGADKTQTSAAETIAEQTSADKTAEETTEGKNLKQRMQQRPVHRHSVLAR